MLRLTLFGGFSATGADGAEIPLKSQKAKALLAYLALSPGKSRSREEIMALLWSERGETQARASLRQVLTVLRKDLGPQAMKAMIITADAVSLDPANVTVARAKVGVTQLSSPFAQGNYSHRLNASQSQFAYLYVCQLGWVSVQSAKFRHHPVAGGRT